jgi:hypothetical protein
MNTTTRVLITAILCVTAVACTKKVKEDPNTDATDSTTSGGTTNTGTGTVTDNGPIRTGAYGPGDLDTDACLRQRVVYFDLDQDALKPEFQNIVACHAKYLRDRPSARMTLEGNAANTTSVWANVAAMRCRHRCRRTVVPAARSRSSATAKSARPAPTPAKTAGAAIAGSRSSTPRSDAFAWGIVRDAPSRPRPARVHRRRVFFVTLLAWVVPS